MPPATIRSATLFSRSFGAAKPSDAGTALGCPIDRQPEEKRSQSQLGIQGGIKPALVLDACEADFTNGSREPAHVRALSGQYGLNGLHPLREVGSPPMAQAPDVLRQASAGFRTPTARPPLSTMPKLQALSVVRRRRSAY